MSTKTTFKRISLVAVAAMSMGVLTSVAPVSAAITANTVTLSDTSASVAVGSPATFTITDSFTAGVIDEESIITVERTTAPAGATANKTGIVLTAGTPVVSAAAGTSVVTAAVTTTAPFVTNTKTVAIGQFKSITSVAFTPDVAGVYVLTISQTGDATTDAAAQTFTVYAGYSADLAKPNTAFPIQGSNITTAWTGINAGLATVRITNFPVTARRYYVAVTGGTLNSVVSNGLFATASGGSASTFNLTNGANLTGGVDFFGRSATTVSDSVDIQVSSTGASATVTVTYYDPTTGAATVYSTATASFAAAPVLSVANSTSFIDSTTASTFGTGAKDEILSVSGTVATTRLATIKVTLKDSALTAMSAKTLSAVVTGPGLVQGKVGTGVLNTYTNGSASGSRVATVDTDALGQGFFAVFSDGSGGVGTITISQGTTVIATETITFAGIATQLKDNNVDAAGDSLNSVFIPKGGTGTLSVGSYDVAGNKVSATPTGLVVTSDATSVATVSISGGTGTITVTGVAAGKANITISVGALATATIKLVIPVEVTLTTAKTVTMSFDKTSYAPGEKMTLTVKATDANGAGVADGARVLFSDTATANVALGTLPTGTVTLAGGIATYTYYAPFAAGDITVTAKEGAAVDAVIASTTAVPYTAATITATASVVNAGVDAATDAASEATDAANAATDAALAAADAADAATAAAEDASAAVAKLAKSVNTALKALKKQITALTKLVNKLL
jgi:trimeric autotransporter adhesin